MTVKVADCRFGTESVSEHGNDVCGRLKIVVLAQNSAGAVNDLN